MKTTVASITTRQIQEVPAISNQLYTQTDIPEPYRVDAKPFISRPFFVGEVTFPSTAAMHSLLTTSIKFLPGDAVRANTSLTNLFKIAALGRPELMLNVSLAGTISHAGCVLVGVLPPLPTYPTTPNKKLINTILSGPHAFLFANEATSVALEVPFYCNSDLTTTDMEQGSYVTTVDLLTANGNYATLVFYVLNPLRPSTGASTDLKIVIEACFKTFELAVPTPRYVSWVAQSGRSDSPDFTRPPSMTLDQVLQELTTTINALNVDIGDTTATEPAHKENKKKKHRKRKMLMAMAPTIISIATLAGVIVRLVVSVAADDPVATSESMNVINDFFQPQSGVGGFISGLFDNVAGGLKRIANDAIDGGRVLVKEYTGLHNPNIPINTNRVITTPVNYMNLTDGQQYFEKLDPYAKFDRILDQPIFGTSIDEMAISHITGKKQYIGTVTVRSGDAVGKLLWVRPISPFQGGIKTNTEDSSVTIANNIELMHTFHRAWRGGLKLEIQSVMNNKQQVKLKVIKMYNPSVNSLSQYPVYNSISNAPSHLLEFTAGGQTQEVDLPYLARNKLTPCATNMDVEAMLHGLYYIYVAQPLANSESSPTEISFNLYIRGDNDLTFYGYVKSSTYHDSFDLFGVVPASKPKSIFQDVTYCHLDEDQRFYEPSSKDFVIKSVQTYNDTKPTHRYASIPMSTQVDNLESTPMADFYKANLKRKEYYRNRIPNYDLLKEKGLFLYDTAGRVKAIKRMPYIQHSWNPQSGPIEVMNEPQEQNNTVTRDDKEEALFDMSRLMPTLDIRPLIRRMYKGLSEDLHVDRKSNINYTLNLSGIVGEDPTTWAYTPIESISRMYYGKTLGYKVRMMCTVDPTEDTSSTIQDLTCRVFYLPQDLGIISTTRTVTSALPNLNSFVSPMVASIIGDPPLPLTIVSRNTDTQTIVYEFVVPDTSFFKFLGGPDKFYNFAGSTAYPKLAISDFGSLVFQFSNTTNKEIRFHIEMFFGLTDESRLGFHSIAPPVKVAKYDAYYLGTDTVVNDPATATLNPFTYYGGIP